MTKEEVLLKVFGEGAKVEKPLLGGMMNESYIVSYNGKRYVLYMPTEQANEMVNRQQEKDDQALAYSLGVTSKNVYFDVEHGIKINEFLEGSSLNKVDSYDVKKVAKILKTLHNSTKLSDFDYLPFKRFVGYEAEAREFVKEFDSNFGMMKKLLLENKQFLESQRKVICHNDYQRSNIVASDSGEYYMIDFEFTGNNDPIYDIATFGNGKVSEGYELLVEYFGNPTKEEKMRYYLWRIYVSLQWYLVALVKHYRGEGEAHHMNFLDVASFFMTIANDALDGYQKLN